MKLARNWQELRETAVFCEQEMAHPERFELSSRPRVAAADHAALFQINGLAQRRGRLRTGVAGKLARNWQAGAPG